jgi:magnesium transporter
MVETASHPTSLAETCRVLVYRQGDLQVDVPYSEIDRLIAEPGTIVWLDIERPADEEFDLIAEEFGLHPLAIEDVRKPHQRPKVDQYDDSKLIVLFDALFTPQHRSVALHEVNVFVGSNYLITVHRYPVTAIETLRERWRRRPELVEPHPLGFLLYHLADELVDGYFPIVDALGARVEAIEERVFGSFDRTLLREFFAIRRDLVQLRRVLGPERDLFNLLARRAEPAQRAIAPYFNDVVDLLLRLTDSVDALRDLLGAALESYLTVQSNSLNETMRRLTALTVALMVPTLIAGVYGMNYELTPSNEWTGGFWFAVGLMVLCASGALTWFRRRNWL